MSLDLARIKYQLELDIRGMKVSINKENDQKWNNNYAYKVRIIENRKQMIEDWYKSLPTHKGTYYKILADPIYKLLLSFLDVSREKFINLLEGIASLIGV